MTKIKADFDARILRIKKNVLRNMNGYFADQAEWDEVSASLAKYSVFYTNVFSAWVKAIVFYQFEVKPFAEKFLLSDTSAKLDKENLLGHHYELIRNQWIDRSAVTLLLSNDIDKIHLTKASDFHSLHLIQNGYKDDIAFINENNNEAIFSTIIPHVMTGMLLGIEHNDIFNSLPSDTKSREKLWSRTWKLLCLIKQNESIKLLKPAWASVINEWRLCFIGSDFHLFSESNLIFLYYLYCRATTQDFTLRNFSNDILL